MNTGERIWLGIAIFFLALFAAGTFVGAGLSIYRMIFL